MNHATALILLAGFVLRGLLALILPPGYDESYYLFYGQHPALSYFDHPPAVALWSALGQGLPSLLRLEPVLALRLPGLFSYSASLALLASATCRWFGARAAWIAAALGSLSPLLLACGGLLLLPDSPLLLMMSVLLWWLSRHPLHAPRRAWESLLFGLILGALCLAKYQGLLLVLTLALLRLFDSLRQRQLRWRDTALVLLGFVATSAPLWIWNAQNDWVSFTFHSGRSASTVFHWQGPPLFLLSQLALLFPSIGVLLLLALLRGPGRLLQALAWPQLLMFLLLSGRMQVLASWLVPAWWLLLPPAAALLARPGLWSRLWLRLLVVVTALASPVLSLAAAAHVRWGVASALVPPAADTSGQLLQPQALRSELSRHPAIWKALLDAEVIGSNRYELPGFLALALQGRTRAQFTTYSGDNRGFDHWRQHLNPRASRGVLFAVVGDYAPISSLAVPSPDQRWQFGPLRPLGKVVVRRGGRPAATLEFYGFDPSLVRSGRSLS